jgi:hypothetical protein
MRLGAFMALLACLALPQGSALAVDDPAPPASALERLALIETNHPYLPIVRYALEQAERRAAGREVRSAILVDRVSLIDPKAIDCGNKAFAVLIDLDAAPGETIIEGEPTGFGQLLQLLRDSGIAIAWVSDRSPSVLEDDLARLRAGEIPLVGQGDIELYGWGGVSKQQHRKTLATSHCVLAIAGDQKADFDELFLYLRDPDYAIRLEAWTNRGWFLLPYPASVIDANPSPQAEEVEPTP